MLVKKVKFNNPAEEVTYLQSPVDDKYYTLYDWSWMVDTAPSTVVNYLSKRDTYEEIFDNQDRTSELADKLRKYAMVQPAFNKFCFPPTTSQ